MPVSEAESPDQSRHRFGTRYAQRVVANPWDPEFPVDARLAAALIDEQFPEFRPATALPLGQGWDNTAFLVNSDAVFRFPRRKIAVPLLKTELSVLPRLARRLTIPVPIPRWCGSPSGRYPWPFAGYPRLRGRDASSGLTDDERRRLARPLAVFLRELHEVPESDAAAWGVGVDELGRLSVDRYAPRIRAAYSAWVTRSAMADRDETCEAVLREAASVRPTAVRCLVHGDLYSRQMLVEDSALSGVIDWGDVHRGHPAVDLSIVWTFLPPGARDEFYAVYGPLDESTTALARFRAVVYATVLDSYGREHRDGALIAEATGIFRRLVS